MKEANLRGRYKIEGVLGQGGMGKVYKGIDLIQNVPVAIKKILSPTEELRARFEREHYFLSLINHNNILKAYDFFEEEGNLFLVLEFVEGITFREFMDQYSGSLDLQSKLAITIQISRAIEVVNLAGIIHRDIKPDNIIVNSKTGNLKILDLGIAKSIKCDLPNLSITGQQIGTPEYMSPEQVNGEVHKNTDIFALGILFYQFFLGLDSSPFKGLDVFSTMLNISNEELPSLISQGNCKSECIRKVSCTVGKALEKEQSLRTESASVLANELLEIYKNLKIDKNETNAIPATKIWYPSKGLSKREIEKIQKVSKKINVIKKEKHLKTARRKKKVIVLVFIVTVIVILIFGLSSTKNINLRKESLSENLLAAKAQKYFEKGKEEKNEIKAIELYKKAASLGNIEAMVRLGAIYYKDRDYKKALEWYKKAANLGSAKGMWSVGYCYNFGIVVKKNYDKALEWYEKAANLGHVKAMYNLGNLYRNGLGVEKNKVKAIEWYGKAASLGDTEAMIRLGIIYSRGEIVEKDYKKTVELLKTAANLGHSGAMYNLGVMYYKGEGVKKDYKKAIEWYIKAVNLGHVEAMYDLGAMYYEGWGVEKDYKKAANWYGKAANLGHNRSMLNLGLMYYNGQKIKKNKIKGMKLLTKAANSGYEKAQKAINMLKDK